MLWLVGGKQVPLQLIMPITEKPSLFNFHLYCSFCCASWESQMEEKEWVINPA